MARPEKIIIVENDIPIAARLSLQLNRLGYNITGIFSRAKDALHFLEQEVPDLILLDDQLKGQLNGIETNRIENKKTSSPVVYFNKRTADTLDRIIPKSLRSRKKRLQKEVKDSLKKNKPGQNGEIYKESAHCILKDRIFVRHNDKMVRISLNDIHYIEADRNYCKVYTKDRKYLLVTTLKEVDEKLSDKRFLRIHRSYIANISHIDEIGGNHVVINSHSLPLSKNMRPELFKHLQVI
ncbi:LytR/AlgR family response regulator transcription factor [Christiangramia sabulilitoris]|uniref:Response regulator transcription factor n=1 Tax=Christiangramia sabulilitoris TaxID=2583991 RepID=A0A550I6Z6_9FLAO|nr:LytTR family DNA-binding domain-containing protein [Christiangramia sabulilitoris]TRO66743.1 response regulator transcription factor [Christiangramia sabulilitoris]